ncbi:MAG: DUF72 domain-containing protein [Actinomycetota bacterium]|nr:DUF72 domain-containing protein [Actinomycetota bacterium]
MIKVGCCGFPVKKQRYFEHFDVIEIQRTFYNLPKIETVLKWRGEAPNGFEFTLKAWQLITHPSKSPTYKKAGLQVSEECGGKYGFFRPTGEVFEAWRKTKEIGRALSARIILFQCPASFKPTTENIKNLKNFFKTIDRHDFLMVWEPRGEWDDRDIIALCRELNLIHCVDPFEGESLHGEIKYFRLHGGPGYRHKYSKEELLWLKEKCSRHKVTYCMFNNIVMFDDALRFKEILTV